MYIISLVWTNIRNKLLKIVCARPEHCKTLLASLSEVCKNKS